jgi:putative ABC transport system permease protein
MNLRTCTLREVQRRPGRMLLTLLGITLGLATVVATRLTTQTVQGAYRDLFAGVTGGSALEVTAPAYAPFAEGLAGKLRQVPGVAKVSLRARGVAAVVGPAGGVTAPLVGVEVGEGCGWSVRRGRELEGDNEALLDESLARGLGVSPGESFRLWTPAGLVPLRLAGAVEGQGAAASGGMLVVSLATARRLFTLPAGQVNCLRLELEEGAVVAHVRAEAARLLPAGLGVRTPGGHGAQAQATLLAAEQGLSALGVMALITAAFVIFNTFLLNLAERKRHLALLKTLGATHRQVFRLLLAEALLLGVVGAVAGSLVGAGLSLLLLRVMEQFLGVGLPALKLTPGPFLVALVVGPATPLAAACLPAWKASCRPPLDGLLPCRGEDGRASCIKVGVLGLLCLAVGMGPAVLLCRGGFSVPVSQTMLPLTLGVLLVGCVFSFPLLLSPLLWLLRLAPWRLVGRMAVEALARQRARTGLTAGVLFLALTVAVGFGQTLRGIMTDMHDWYAKTVVADYLVRASMPDTSLSLASPVPSSLAKELIRTPGVAVVEKLAFLPSEANGQDALVLARTFVADGPLPMDLREGTSAEVREGLMRGETVVGTALAGQLGLHRGDALTLTTAKGPEQVRVAGVATEFGGGGSALYLEWSHALRLYEMPGAHVLLVTARPGEAPTLGKRLRAFCAGRKLILQSNRDLRDQIDGLLMRVTGAIWALLLLIFVVASLGIVNTLQMNIQDQMRAFGVLRALGMKAAQVRGMVLRQALLLGVLTLPPGALAGVGLAYVISRGSANWAAAPISFRLDPAILAGACGIGLASALLAAVLPARRAARLVVLKALS